MLAFNLARGHVGGLLRTLKLLQGMYLVVIHFLVLHNFGNKQKDIELTPIQ